MVYTNEQIEKYLEILNNYKTTGRKKIDALDVGNVKVIVSLLIQVIRFARSVARVTVMFWGIMIGKIMIDYILERRVFIRERITMRKRLIKFLKDFT